MRMGQRNNIWIILLLLIIELPVIFFLTYFTLGLKERLLEEFSANPYGLFFEKIGLIYLLLIMLSMMLLMIMKLLIKIGKCRYEFNLVRCFFRNAIYIIPVILMIVVYKLLTRGYV